MLEKRGTKIKKRLAIDSVEAELVKMMFRYYTHGDGKSGPLGIKEIVKRLNADGYRTRRGARFGVGSLHAILTNPVYIGTWTFIRRNAKTRQEKPGSEYVTIEVPAIIERDVFEAVQKLLKARNPRVTPRRIVTGPILLTGLAVCADCGGSMTLRSGTSKNGTLHRYYSCSTANRQGKTGCRGRSIPMSKLDTLVVHHLCDRLLAAERLTDMLAKLSAGHAARRAEVDRRATALQREVTDATEKLKRLYRMVEEGLAERDDIVGERIGSLKLDLERAQAALERVRPQALAGHDLPLDLIERFGRTMRESITNGEIPFRKAYIRSVVDRIEIGDNTIRIIGSIDTLGEAVAEKPAAASGVRGFERKWRAQYPLPWQ